MARFYLHRVVYRCQRKVRALTSIKEAEFVINNPRAPRRKKGAKQLIRGLGSGVPGEAVSFDPDYKGALLTEFYTNLFKATETQEVLPSWVRLGGRFKDSDLQGMPRIDGSLIRRAINLFNNNKSCAEDNVVSVMLRVLDEDVLDLIADAIKIRILNRETEDVEENTSGGGQLEICSTPLRRQHRQAGRTWHEETPRHSAHRGGIGNVLRR